MRSKEAFAYSRSTGYFCSVATDHPVPCRRVTPQRAEGLGLAQCHLRRDFVRHLKASNQVRNRYGIRHLEIELRMFCDSRPYGGLNGGCELAQINRDRFGHLITPSHQNINPKTDASSTRQGFSLAAIRNLTSNHFSQQDRRRHAGATCRGSISEISPFRPNPRFAHTGRVLIKRADRSASPS